MSYQTKITGQKKHNLKKKPDTPGFNQSFFTVPNTLWYNYAVNWLPHKKKPLVCLPCASANKTRAKYGKKMFSHSTTHQFLSAITRCEDFERVVISEPLTIVPYALEGQLENLSDGRKIAIIDLVYLFRTNFTTERVLFELINNTDFLERIDAVSLFYHDQGRNAYDPLPFTIGPIIMKKPWRNMSKVFDHPYWGYSGNLLIVSPNLIEDIHGDFRISRVDKQALFDMFQRFDELDSDTRSTRTHRMFTHFYEQEYDLGD